jgi:hypothetical protein
MDRRGDPPLERRRTVDEEEEIIDLMPVRKRRRWPLVVAIAGVAVLMLACGGGALWYFVFRGVSLKQRIEPPDKAWTVKLPDAPQTSNVKDERSEFIYSRPGKDAEFTVSVIESKSANPDGPTFDIAAGLLFLGVTQKYNADAGTAGNTQAATAPYLGEFPRRQFELMMADRGKLTVQIIAANWGNNSSTVFVLATIGKDVSEVERLAFHNSVEIRKNAR